ncbi:hypothetical protein pb186bvf_013318 [Paramecium bursaria]
MSRPNQMDVSIVIELPLEYPDYMNLLGMTIQTTIGYICLDLQTFITLYFISQIDQGLLQMAGIGIANSLILIFLIPIGFAFNQSLNLQTSQTRVIRGSNESSKVRLSKRILVIEIYLLWIILTILGVILYFSKTLIQEIFDFDENSKVIDHAWDYLIFLLPSKIIALTFDSLKNYLMAYNITYPFIIIHSIVTMIYVGLSYFFIIQLKMGLEGAGISILLSELLNLLGIIGNFEFIQVLVFIMAGLNQTVFSQIKQLTRNDWNLAKQFIKISLPIIVHLFSYYSVFALLIMLSFGLSVKHINLSYLILSSALLILEFPKSLSLTSITLVGYEKSKGQLSRAQSYVVTSTVIYFIYSCFLYLIFSTFKDNIIDYLYEENKDQIDFNGMFNWFLISIVISDGLQGTLSGSLKGIKKVKIVSYCTFLAYYIICLPIALYHIKDENDCGKWILISFVIGNSILCILFIIFLYTSDWTSRYSQLPILQELDKNKKQIQVDIELEES